MPLCVPGMQAFVLDNSSLQNVSDREKQMLYEDAAITAVCIGINYKLVKKQGNQQGLSEAREMAAVNFTSLTSGMLPPSGELSAKVINDVAHAVSKTAQRNSNKSLSNTEQIHHRQYEVKRYYQGLNVQPFVFLHPSN